ncbi:hypothetical protein KBX37_06620 [Micromonospora sp. U56]|uniref:hypothetical protein n=1 Tax=Micromonospora sp. U56 TaxID=2824900 RepID=UPI001B3640CD|nr:hypothetical protein [Micromonospora sp. U56]MBQ0892777.1 hypothetical protein [Micromonospora sp. U56]
MVDDLDLGINVIVRGTDKIDAVGIQHRLRLLLGGQAPVCYLFLPKLREPMGSPVRIADLTSTCIRPSSIRWYVAEPYLIEGRPPHTFWHVLDRLRPVLPAPRDSYFDPARLAALDRKMSAVLDRRTAARDLTHHVGAARPDLIERVCAEWRRPLAEQVATYQRLTRQRVPQPRAAGLASAGGPIPPATRTAADPPIGR